MHVRPATDKEHHGIDVLLANSYGPVMARLPAQDARDFAAMLPKARARYAEKGLWIVATLEGVMVGCVAYFGPGVIQHPLFECDSAHIQLLGVAPANTKSGVGRALVKHCVALAADDGAREMLLQTSELMPEARRLYLRLGFMMRKELPPMWGNLTYLCVKEVPDTSLEKPRTADRTAGLT